MRVRVAILTVSILLVLALAVCRAQDFSADVTYESSKTRDASSRHLPPSPASKLYVSTDKMRLDSPGLNPTILLVDFGNHTTAAIFPAQKAYQSLASGPPQYFHVADADNACPDWQKALGKEIACEKAGSYMVDGRKTVKYLNKSVAAGESAAAVWIDPSLNFVIKWEDADGGAELHNIKEGPQAPDLFAVPAGYDVLRPQKKGSWKTQRRR